jgi:undecaprenyl-diphosphatase
MYILLGMLLAVFEPQDGAAFLRSGLFAFLIEYPLYLFLKNTIRRDRPCEQFGLEAAIKPSEKFGFPSGHSAAAFVFATVLAQIYPSVALLAYSIAMLIGVSRVLLGVHYPADIVAGAVVGIICGFLSVGSWNL